MAKVKNIFRIITGHCQLPIEAGENDYIIAVDSGLSVVRRQGLKADYLMGDFDSLAEEDLDWARSEGVKIINYPVEKDYTDTELAMDFVLAKGADEIIIYNDLTGRFDHALALVNLLEKSSLEGVKVIIRGQGQELIFLRAGDRVKLKSYEGYLSILAVKDKSVVKASGLKYPMPEFFYRERAIGISNEFIADLAEVEVTEGKVLLILSKNMD